MKISESWIGNCSLFECYITHKRLRTIEVYMIGSLVLKMELLMLCLIFFLNKKSKVDRPGFWARQPIFFQGKYLKYATLSL